MSRNSGFNQERMMRALEEADKKKVPPRFDFSKAGMAKRQGGGSDKTGARVVVDRFGNRRLVRDGEEPDFSYQDRYQIVEHENADGTKSGYVDLRQDAFVERMAEIAKKMVTGGSWIKTKGPTPQIVSEEQMREAVENGDDPEDYRPVNPGALASIVRKAESLGLASTDGMSEEALIAAEAYEDDLQRRLLMPDYDESLLIEDATGDIMIAPERINPDIPARVKRFGYGDRPPVSFDDDVDEDEIDEVFRPPIMKKALLPEDVAPRKARPEEQRVAKREAPRLAMCGGCGYDSIDPSMNFCPRCGTEADSAILVCEFCGDEITMDMNFCPTCGKKLILKPQVVGGKR